MNTEVLITCILSSTLAAAIVTSFKEIILWKMNRKATVEDREDAEDKHEEDTAETLSLHIVEADAHNKEVLATLKDIKSSLEAHVKSDITIERTLYKQTIRSLCIEYLSAGEIDIDDKKVLMELWEVYHNELNGNGYFDELMKSINELHVKVSS